MWKKDTTVRIDIKNSDCDEAVMSEFHNKIGKIVEVVPGMVGRDTLYTVELPNLRRCDFAEGDLFARP